MNENRSKREDERYIYRWHVERRDLISWCMFLWYRCGSADCRIKSMLESTTGCIVETIVCAMGARCCSKINRALLLASLVLLVARVSLNAADERDLFGSIDDNRFNKMAFNDKTRQDFSGRYLDDDRINDTLLNAGQRNFSSASVQDNFLINHSDTIQSIFDPINIVRRIFTDIRRGNATPDSLTNCSKQVTLLGEGLKNGSPWALKMIDASSKIPSGILTGNQRDLGMYDECVRVVVNLIEDAEVEFRGRHCMYKILANIGTTPFTETLSICMPAICQPDEIKLVLDNALDTVAGSIGFNVSVSGVTCSSIEPLEWTAGGIVTIIGFSALLLFLVICTIADFFAIHSKEKIESNSRFGQVRQFSLYTNAQRILSTKISPQTLPGLQGLRFFSMCWVILGHEYFMLLFAPTVNLTDLIQWVTSWQSLYIIIAPFSVDTFFTISGFLMSYLFLKEISTGRKFNLFAYYIHRYLRLTPAFAALLLITIFILPRMGSGASWEANIAAEEKICRESWWSMLLYIHNYVNRGCLGHTWYLAVEMHYFWISPFIFYPLTKKPKIGLVILAACLVVSVAVPAKILYDNRYTSAFFTNGKIETTLATVTNFYTESHIRAAPWLIGVFFGFLVFTRKGSLRKISKWIGWFLAFGGFTFCIFSMRKFQDKDYEYDIVWETFYVAVARPTWSLSVGWIIYACVCGFGGPVTTILSLSIFHPLSRLSYSVYLVHYVIQSTKVKATRVPRFFTTFGAFDAFLSDLMLSVIVGFFLSLFFESPVMVLEKLVRNRSVKRADDLKRKFNVEKVENGIYNPGLTLD